MELYPEATIAEWQSTLRLAHRQLGGVSTGIGFWGSATDVITGALVMGMVERRLSASARSDGLRNLERASHLLAELRAAGVMFPVEEIVGMAMPEPGAWRAQTNVMEPIELSRMSFWERRSFLRKHGLVAADARDGVVEIPGVEDYAPFPGDFLAMELQDDGLVEVRWSSVDTYALAL